MQVRWTDPRLVFPLVAAAIVLALLFPVRQPIKPQQAVVQVYDYIERLPKGSAVMLAVDYDPQAKAELVPMTTAVLRHCLRRDLRVIGMTFWPQGTALGQSIFTAVAQEPQFRHKKAGSDYVYLGYKPGDMAQVITNMGENLPNTFRQDYQNRPTTAMPIFQDVKSLKDVDYLLDLAAGSTPDTWVQFGGDKYSVPMAVGCTAVMGPDMYVRLTARQINGLIAGLRGAADYEVLLERPELGVAGMFAQSIIHVMIIVLVVVGNVAFLATRRRKAPEGERHG